MSDNRTLNVGDPAPDFTLQDRPAPRSACGIFAGRTSSFSSPARLDAGLKHMHARLRQAHRRLSGGEYPGAGYQHRQPFSHDNWAKSVGISNYPLLSDIHRTVVKDYGVYWADWNANSRATFIVDKQGTIRFTSGTERAISEPDKILAEVKKLG